MPQRRGNELPITAMRRSGVSLRLGRALRIAELDAQAGCNGLAGCSPSLCNRESIGRLAGYAISALNPLAPTSMLVRPPPTKMACPIDAAANPMAAWPSRTRIQVSGSASSAQLEPSGSSTRSRTKCWLATRTVRVGGEAGRIAGRSKRPRMGNGDAIVFVQFALPAIVEQAECRVAALLNFGEHDAGADGVDGAGRDVDDIAFRNRPPVNQFGDRTVLDRRTQLLWRYLVLQSSADLRVRLRPKGCTMPRSCRSAFPSRARKCRPDEPGSTMVRW